MFKSHFKFEREHQQGVKPLKEFEKYFKVVFKIVKLSYLFLVFNKIILDLCLN